MTPSTVTNAERISRPISADPTGMAESAMIACVTSPSPRDAAREILVRGARGLARTDGLGAGLEILLGVVAEELEIESAVIVIVGADPDALEIVASHGLGEATSSGLAQAIRNTQHPIARTVADPIPSFDVQPTAPGGPALRSHLPLTVSANGMATVLGVLALAHQHPIAPANRALAEAAADLAAIAIGGR
jgi:hypothetical protein